MPPNWRNASVVSDSSLYSGTSRKLLNVNMHAYVLDVSVRSADCTICTFFYSSPPLGRIQRVLCSCSQSLQFSFFPVPPGTHHCYVDRGSMEWEVWLALIHIASSWNRALDLMILRPIHSAICSEVFIPEIACKFNGYTCNSYIIDVTMHFCTNVQMAEQFPFWRMTTLRWLTAPPVPKVNVLTLNYHILNED